MSAYDRAADRARDAFRNFSGDDILDTLGLVRRSQQSGWWWTALSGLGIGILVGVGVGLAFAPTKGSELRGTLGEKLRRKQLEAVEAVRGVTQ